MADLDVNVNPNPKDATHLAKGKTVQFQTNAVECRVHFTNPAVFNLGYVDLKGGKPQTLTVQADGSTSWSALGPPSRKIGAGAGNPNEIVVP